AVNCRFRAEGVAHCIWTADSWTTRNCLFLGNYITMNGTIADGAKYDMHNCVDFGTPFSLPYQSSDAVHVAIRLTHNTILNGGIGIQVGDVTAVLPDGKSPKPIRLDVSGNIFGSNLFRVQVYGAFLAKRKGFEPE